MAESLAFYRLKDSPVKQHHKVKLRHKISVISKLTKHIMFKTAGTVNVPKTLPYKVFDFIVFFFFSLNESQYFYSLFYLLNVVNVNCFSAGGFKDRRKPPVYAAISIVLYLFKKHSPIFIIYNKAIRLSHHYICCCSLLLCLCKKFLSCLIGIKYRLDKLFFRRLARNISPLNNACRLMCNGWDIFFCQSYLS